MKEYLKSSEEILREQNSTEHGITEEEAARRAEQYGKNKLIEAKQISLLQRFLKQLADPMIIILIAAAVVSGNNGCICRGIFYGCYYYSDCGAD